MKGTLLGNIPQGIRAHIAVIRRIGHRPDTHTVEDNPNNSFEFHCSFKAASIRSILTVPRTGLLSVSALITIWSAMGGVDSVRVGLNRAYDIRETRSIWWLYFQNVLFVIGSAIFLLVFALLIVVLLVRPEGLLGRATVEKV